MNEYQFAGTIKWLNDKFEESNPREWWSECTRKNLPLIKKENCLFKYNNIYTNDNEKVIVIVGASPKLRQDIQYLKSLGEKYIIMVSNSAAKFLIDAGIKPHYVVSIDGDDVISKRDLNFDTSGLTLITTNASSHKVVKNWKGEILWSACYAIDPELKKPVRKLLGRRITMGGNTSTFMASLAFEVFGARMFIFVANEYCYDTQYYAHKRSKWEDKNTTHFRTKDVLGRNRLTNIPLYQYKIWLEKMVDQLTMCTFIDTSFGILGTDCQRLKLMELPDAIKFVNGSFELKERAKTDWRIREKLRYDLEYARNNYRPILGKKAWKHILSKRDCSKIKTVLDVGCGFGQGVALCRNKGLEAYGIDISESLTRFWQMGNIVPFCKITSADKIPFPDDFFDLVASFDVLEHIPEEGIGDVLDELYRVGRSDFFLSICITPAFLKMSDGSEPHVLVKPINWWRDILERHGFHNKVMSLAPSQTHILFILTKKNAPILFEEKNDGTKLPSDHVHVQRRKKVPSRQNGIAVAGRC